MSWQVAQNITKLFLARELCICGKTLLSNRYFHVTSMYWYFRLYLLWTHTCNVWVLSITMAEVAVVLYSGVLIGGLNIPAATTRFRSVIRRPYESSTSWAFRIINIRVAILARNGYGHYHYVQLIYIFLVDLRDYRRLGSIWMWCLCKDACI